MRGVLSPVLTPFVRSAAGGLLMPDPSRFVAHCRWLVRNQVGLAIFGTNSEANSMTVEEKAVLLESLVQQGGVDPARYVKKNAHVMDGRSMLDVETSQQTNACTHAHAQGHARHGRLRHGRHGAADQEGGGAGVRVSVCSEFRKFV